MMTPLEAFQMYMALRAHFKSNYDYIKYGGKLSKSVLQSYQYNKQKYAFEKLARKPDPKGLILSNLLENDDIWITQLFHESAQEVYKNWKKRNESLSYQVSQELGILNSDKFDDNFRCYNNQHPFLFHDYIRGRVSIETMVILNDLLRFTAYWNKSLAGDPIWEITYKKMVKYRSFLSYDKEKMKNLLKTKFLTSQPS